MSERSNRTNHLAYRPKGGAVDSARLFDVVPHGLVVFDARGAATYSNRRADELLRSPRPGRSCCELVCAAASSELAGGCLTRDAIGRWPDQLSREFKITLGDRDLQVAVATIGRESALRVLFRIRPASRIRVPDPAAPDRLPSDSTLRVRALGDLAVETEAGWVPVEALEGRPGQLLRFLVAMRSRPVASEQIADALLPEPTQREALLRVRQYVYQLRLTLEPGRCPGSASPYVITRRGGYGLALGQVDADEFAVRAERGLSSLAAGASASARKDLYGARRLYRGDFLAEDPHADWALPERDRLRELRSRMLRALIELELDDGRFEAAAERAREVTLVDPYDGDVWRTFLELCLCLGRRSEAARQYSQFRHRLRSSFDEEPGFVLSELRAPTPRRLSGDAYPAGKPSVARSRRAEPVG